MYLLMFKINAQDFILLLLWWYCLHCGIISQHHAVLYAKSDVMKECQKHTLLYLTNKLTESTTKCIDRR